MALLQSSNQSFGILEIKLISAFDLVPPRSIARKDLKSYAVIWIDPKQKLRSSVSETAEPRWNDKFVFVVDAETLSSITAAKIVVEIYSAAGPGKMDKLVGTSRVLLRSFVNCGRHYRSVELVGASRALHVRSTSGNSNGVLFLGITVLEGLVFQQISDDKFVGIGSAVDCKRLGGRSNNVAAGKKAGAGEFFRGLFDRIFHGKKMILC